MAKMLSTGNLSTVINNEICTAHLRVLFIAETITSARVVVKGPSFEFRSSGVISERGDDAFYDTVTWLLAPLRCDAELVNKLVDNLEE